MISGVGSVYNVYIELVIPSHPHDVIAQITYCVQEKRAIDTGNACLRTALRLRRACRQRSVRSGFEHPKGSYAWAIDDLRQARLPN